jgi:hypothetical protein
MKRGSRDLFVSIDGRPSPCSADGRNADEEFEAVDRSGGQGTVKAHGKEEKTRVFISYSRSDTVFADKLLALLSLRA